jgi:hypothetical protein
MNCWHCGHDLIWGGDHSPIDDEEYQMETNLSCPECNSFYLVYLPHEDDEDE